jgi:quercetin dioxygenase-like cupin family protein
LELYPQKPRRTVMVKLALGILALSLTASVGLAEEMTVATPDAIKWGPAPPVFAPGMQFAVISGDPYGSGEYVIREKMPAGYAFPAHYHPGTENFTIISGTFHIGMGDKLDKKHAQTLKAGAFASMPAKMNHYAWASTAAVIQLHGVAPLAITYVNPDDDPSKVGAASR